MADRGPNLNSTLFLHRIILPAHVRGCLFSAGQNAPNATLLCLSPTRTGFGQWQQQHQPEQRPTTNNQLAKLRCVKSEHRWLLARTLRYAKRIKLIVILTFFNLLLLDWYAECLPHLGPNRPVRRSPPLINSSVQLLLCGASRFHYLNMTTTTTITVCRGKHKFEIIETPFEIKKINQFNPPILNGK